MAKDPIRAPDRDAGSSEVMASIDTDRGADRLIIADITDNDRWLSTPARDGVSLADWH